MNICTSENIYLRIITSMRGLLTVALACASTLSFSAVVCPLGDSITVGQWGGGFTPGAWRSRLESIDPTISFVGPNTNNAAPGQVSVGHAAWSGVRSDWFPPRTSLWAPWLVQADTAVLMIGTNDVIQGFTASQASASIEATARLILTFGPNQTFVLATVAPRKDGTHQSTIDQINNSIVELVGTLRAEGYNAVLAPTHWSYNPVAERMIDNYHPNAACYDAIALILHQALQPLDGDIDGDGVVSILDYILLSDAFDLAEGDPGFNPAADLDHDGIIGIFDYIILSDNFDKTKWQE